MALLIGPVVALLGVLAAYLVLRTRAKARTSPYANRRSELQRLAAARRAHALDPSAPAPPAMKTTMPAAALPASAPARSGDAWDSSPTRPVETAAAPPATPAAAPPPAAAAAAPPQQFESTATVEPPPAAPAAEPEVEVRPPEADDWSPTLPPTPAAAPAPPEPAPAPPGPPAPSVAEEPPGPAATMPAEATPATVPPLPETGWADTLPPAPPPPESASAPAPAPVPTAPLGAEAAAPPLPAAAAPQAPEATAPPLREATAPPLREAAAPQAPEAMAPAVPGAAAEPDWQVVPETKPVPEAAAPDPEQPAGWSIIGEGGTVIDPEDLRRQALESATLPGRPKGRSQDASLGVEVETGEGRSQTVLTYAALVASLVGVLLGVILMISSTK